NTRSSRSTWSRSVRVVPGTTSRRPMSSARANRNPGAVGAPVPATEGAGCRIQEPTAAARAGRLGCDARYVPGRQVLGSTVEARRGSCGRGPPFPARAEAWGTHNRPGPTCGGRHEGRRAAAGGRRGTGNGSGHEDPYGGAGGYGRPAAGGRPNGSRAGNGGSGFRGSGRDAGRGGYGPDDGYPAAGGRRAFRGSQIGRELRSRL